MSSAEQGRINWVQVIGAALAAVSSAILLSTLGVAGTVIGAAFGSIIASVGGALYSRGITASHQQVAAQTAALRRATQARGRGPDGTAVMDSVPDPATSGAAGTPSAPPGAEGVETDATDERADADDESGSPGDTLFQAEPGKPLPWKRLAVVAGALFLGVMIAITGFELLTGKPVSSLTGGSDDTGTTLFQKHSDTGASPSPTPSGQTSGSPSPSDSTSPSDESTATPTGSATPTESPTGLPTDTASPLNSDTASPTATTPDAGG